MWLDPNLSLRWGPYFREASEDNARLVDMVIKAKNEGIIVRRTAIEKVSAIFDIENIDQYEERLDEENEENETAAMAMKQAMGGFNDDGSPKSADKEKKKPAAEGNLGGNPKFMPGKR